MKTYRRVVLVLLVLQAAVTGFLIALSFASNLNENKFGLLLVAELVLFAMMTFIFRTERLQGVPSPTWIAVGSTIVIGFFVSSLIFAF